MIRIKFLLLDMKSDIIKKLKKQYFHGNVINLLLNMNEQKNDKSPLEELRSIQRKYIRGIGRNLNSYRIAYLYCLHDLKHEHEKMTTEDIMKTDKLCEQIFHIDCTRKGNTNCREHRNRFIYINNYLYKRKGDLYPDSNNFK